MPTLIFQEGDLPEEYIPLPSGMVIDYERLGIDRSRIFDLAAQSGSSYGYSTLYTATLTTEETLRQFSEAFLEILDERERERFILGRWPGCLGDDVRSIKSLEKSRQILIEHLNENQKVDFLHHKSFAVIGSESKRYYEILPWDSFGIRFMPKSIFMCATTNKQVPIYDEMLINKLYLETDEYEFVKKCNFKNSEEAEELHKIIGLKEKEKQSWVFELAGYIRSYGR